MIGESLSHFEIIDKLGEGGMGVVYKARDTKLNRLVAIKVLPPDRLADAERKRRFVQEAQSASALNHPHVCVIHEVGELEDGSPFLAFEFLEGVRDRWALVITCDLLPPGLARRHDPLAWLVRITSLLVPVREMGIEESPLGNWDWTWVLLTLPVPGA